MAARLTTAERRADIVDAAIVEFAKRGLEGTSTYDIARRAGISQPYLFRLFGTKKELFKAATEQCFRQQLEFFEHAAKGKDGEEALRAIGDAYLDEMLTEPLRVQGQVHAYAACSDPEIRDVVRVGYGELVAYAANVSGLPTDQIANFFAAATLLSVLAPMRTQNCDEDWAARLIEECAATLAGSPAELVGERA